VSKRKVGAESRPARKFSIPRLTKRLRSSLTHRYSRS
jgi:hypothetical protein